MDYVAKGDISSFDDSVHGFFDVENDFVDNNIVELFGRIFLFDNKCSIFVYDIYRGNVLGLYVQYSQVFYCYLLYVMLVQNGIDMVDFYQLKELYTKYGKICGQLDILEDRISKLRLCNSEAVGDLVRRRDIVVELRDSLQLQIDKSKPSIDKRQLIGVEGKDIWQDVQKWIGFTSEVDMTEMFKKSSVVST